MILFFDTETTGLARFDMPSDWEGQPHLVQIAMLLTEDDGSEAACVSAIVDPGVPIPEAVSKVHGITTEKAERCGLSASLAVTLFDRFMRYADTVVAHNLKFDRAIIEAQWNRYLKSQSMIEKILENKARVCTMEIAAPIVNLPPTERMISAGMTKPKPPRLSECIKFFFDEELEGAHDALVDVRACSRIYFKMKEDGFIS